MARYENFVVNQLTRGGTNFKGVSVQEKDASGNVFACRGTSIPADALTGFATGCIFTRTTTPVGGSFTRFVNVGTSSSCKFRELGLGSAGYGIFRASGPITSTTGSATQTVTHPDLTLTTDIGFCEYQTTDDSDTMRSVAITQSTLTAVMSADPLSAHKHQWAAIRQGCMPAFNIVAAGTVATVGGGVSETITVAGVVATDIAFATYSATDDSDVICNVAAGAGNVVVKMSADPGATHGLHYCVLRPIGVTKPSHYIAFAGVHTTVADGGGVNAITVTGALATDVAICNIHTNAGTTTLKKAVMTANTLTATFSADPSTTHKLAYMILRAY